MAHFAELDENNIVLRVLVVPNEEEHRGQEYLAVDCNLGGQWVQTSFNKRIRKNFASIGMIYDITRDAFYVPTPPLPSFVFDEETCQWKIPIPVPDLEQPWKWKEDTQEWVLPQWYQPS